MQANKHVFFSKATIQQAAICLLHETFFILSLQETALNHVKTAGLLVDGFGSTPEMSKRNLIWVVTKMQILVDRYPSW